MSNNHLLNKKIGERLTKELKKKYGDKRGFQANFIRDLNEKNGYPRENLSSDCFIDKTTLHNILKGITTLDIDRAQSFADVLGVSAKYLLCIDEYPSETVRKKEILKAEKNKWSSRSIERSELFRFVFEMMSASCKIRFNINEIRINNDKHIDKKSGIIIYENKTFKMYISEKMIVVPDEDFYSAFFSPELIFQFYNGEKLRYIQIVDKISVIRKASSIDLDINDFIRMINDISCSIKNTLRGRIDYWFKYSDYDYHNDFDNAYVFWDD